MQQEERGPKPQQSSYHAQSSPNAQPPQNTSPSDQSAPTQQQQQQPQQQAQQPQPGTIQTMRLRQDQPSVTQSQTRSRKRKSPPSADALQPVPPPPPPANTMQHTLPPAHTLVPPPHLPGHVIPPPGYQYSPGEFPPAGLPPPHSLGHPPPTEIVQEQRPQSQPSNGAATTNTSGANRTLSQSKRAEQNRKAQRAFRERRDQHVKALESRSQLLDAALASADEANRRWEECRALVDQLRIENAALRAALSQSQMLGSGGTSGAPPGGSDENRSAPTRATDVTKGAEEPKE